MFRSNSSLGIPRKVVAYYLLFCLVAVSWLALGILYKSYSMMDSRTTSACLSRLGKTAAALELDYLINGKENLQEVLSNSRWSSELREYSIVGLEGKILAHSDSTQIGQKVVEPTGNRLRWGNVSGIQYENEQGQTVNEYQVPLIADEDHFGSLRVSVQQLGFWSTLAGIIGSAPLAFLVPLGMISLGALFLARLANPIAKVDSQLRTIALERPTADLKLNAIQANDAISIGWNRVVDSLQNRNSAENSDDLESRLAKVVATRQQGELQDVLHNLAEGVAVTNVEGRITFANRAVAALLGEEATDGELEGIELEGHIIKNWGSGDKGKLFEDAASHRPVITEVDHLGEVGQRTLRIARLPLESESVHGHVWSVRDVTQQKLTEKTRDQFIDVATHELRTPLSNIKAYAETLVTSEEIEIEEQKEFCNIINSEVTRLARFVDDLLSISSMEAGSIALERQRTISARLFEEVIAKVQPLMNRKSIEFEVHLPEKMADMRLDKDKIVAVLVNMLGNAAKYTPDKGRVSLRVKHDETHLQIAVEDTGVGISEEELPKVFDKFFRSSNPDVQEETGTGLGLSLALEVVRMHGGDITVESQLGQGTTFLATIPIR